MIGLAVSVRGIYEFIDGSSDDSHPTSTSVAATYDSSGEVDYLDTFNQSINDFQNITVLAGM